VRWRFASTKNAIWGGLKILLSINLELSGGRCEVVEVEIKRIEGVVEIYMKRRGDGKELEVPIYSL
jgi:hypothetical protein